MIARLASSVCASPKGWLVSALLLLAIAVPFGVGVVERFSTADPFRVPGSDAALGEARFEEITGSRAAPTVALLLTAPDGVETTAGLRRVRAVTRRLKTVDGMARVADLRDVRRAERTARRNGWRDRLPGAVSRDGTQTLILGYAEPSTIPATLAARVEHAFEGSTDLVIGGAGVAEWRFEELITADLARAELIAFPLLLLGALWAFRGGVAALLPVGIGLATILCSLAMLRLVNAVFPLSIFALNLSLALGLGLAVDYCLFIVSRFREERAAGIGSRLAMRQTLHTAGRSVAFSAATVCVSLAALLVFPQGFLRSMAIAGALTTLVAAALALTVLPSVIMLLGDRLNGLAPRRWRVVTTGGATSLFWRRTARVVMRRPATVAVLTLVVLATAALPFLRVELTGIDTRSLPAGDPARVVDRVTADAFARAGTDPISIVLADVVASDRDDVVAYARRLGDLPGVRSVSYPAALDGVGSWAIDVIPRGPALGSVATRLIADVRAASPPGPAFVSGPTAYFVDQQAAIGARLPWFLGLIAVLTIAILFLLTGSVVLPVKAVVMNAASLCAAFGVLVFVFQDGRLEGLLGFESQGALESTQPLLLLALAYGLSTDYGVFLLARIREGVEDGLTNEAAVSRGLAQTGRIITSAALLFCIAVGAFATSGVLHVKQVGVGTAVAVVIDATVIRALLVPALMAMFGARNWWAPAPLARWHRRWAPREGAPPLPVVWTPRPARAPAPSAPSFPQL